MSNWKYEINDGLVAFYENGIERNIDKVFDDLNATEARIAELEASNELHRNINHKVAIALGLKSGDSWHDLPKRVIDLCERKDELEMFVDQLVEAGDEMSDQSYWNENKWLALVKGWKERKK